jgi:hypothetical protein
VRSLVGYWVATVRLDRHSIGRLAVLTVLALAAALAPRGADAASLGVDVRVVDAASGKPVEGAVVTLVDEPALPVSRLRGGTTYRIEGLRSGLHTIAAAAQGYRPERGQFLLTAPGTLVTVALKRSDEAT